jgi:tripartite-type tricarboxylate transporter receptor subunit TctC
MTRLLTPTRRRFLSGAAAVGGAAAFGVRPAFAQSWPDRALNVVIPTAEGGGADRDARTFARVWRDHIGVDLEYGYYPGAAGQVGYQFYMEREPDAYNLLFANLGPEVIMLETQDTGIEVGEDIVYIQQTSSEPMAILVGANSPIRTIEELVELGQSRTVTISTSRLPHPGSIGVLALADATGAQLRLIPYGGGNPTAMAAITQEVDASVLPFANPIALGDQARVLAVFADTNVAAEESGNAPTINDALGTDLPGFDSSRAWGVHKAAYDAHPDRIARLKESMQATLADPAYPAAVQETGLPTAFIDAGDEEKAMATAFAMRDLARKYRDLLSGA